MSAKKSLGIVGRKGRHEPTVHRRRQVRAGDPDRSHPNRITQVKTVETDGYNAVQVAVGGNAPRW